VQRPEGRRVHLQAQRPALPCAVLTVGTELCVVSLQHESGTILSSEEAYARIAANLAVMIK
jgi:hypothetical protein